MVQMGTSRNLKLPNLGTQSGPVDTRATVESSELIIINS